MNGRADTESNEDKQNQSDAGATKSSLQLSLIGILHTRLNREESSAGCNDAESRIRIGVSTGPNFGRHNAIFCVINALISLLFKAVSSPKLTSSIFGCSMFRVSMGSAYLLPIKKAVTSF